MTDDQYKRLVAKFDADSKEAQIALEKAQAYAKSGRLMFAAREYKRAANAFGRMAQTRDMIGYLKERAA